MSRFGKLRAEVWEISGGICEWPKCQRHASDMAHVEPRGMGGRRSVDTLDNCAALCRYHHDLLDGRIKWPDPDSALTDARLRRNWFKTALAASRGAFDLRST